MSLRTRWATDADVRQIAQLWHRSWLDAHERLIPRRALAHCTQHSFVKRALGCVYEEDTTSLRSRRPTALLAEVDSKLMAFTVIRGGNEIEHFFVQASAHGTGVASTLLQHAELVMQDERGSETAWLVCATGNARALKFYEKHAWARTPRQSWMNPAPWVPSLIGSDMDAALTDNEVAATTLRCTAMKKMLGFDANPNDGAYKTW